MNKKEFENILDNLQTYIYITDPKTHEIVFINKALREEFSLGSRPGMVCWKVLQSGQKGQCDFCKIPQLLKNNVIGEKIHWQENNLKSGRVFDNYDSLIEIEGRIYHMQESIDRTDMLSLSEKATVDDLCGILNRWAGKEQLRLSLCNLSPEDNLLVVLLDVDCLKTVNDSFGHIEGDFFLQKLSQALKLQLSVPDFIFRLSGDEFIIVLHNKTKAQGEELMAACRTYTEKLREKCRKPYDFSFSYGIFEIYPPVAHDINEIISMADEKMYEAKLRRHKTKRLEKKDQVFPGNRSTAEFVYDSSLLYDALINTTDDFIYVCNMETGMFRYCPAQVDLFQLPGQVLENPLPIWEKIVHPEDWERFYRSNMEIVDGKADYHTVEFRAKNRHGEYTWLKCRGKLVQDPSTGESLFAGIMSPLGKQNKIDSLTQLPNFQEFLRAIQEKITQNPSASLGVAIIDIDDFNQVNNVYGRSYGDSSLKIFSRLIQSFLWDNASLYRLEKDSFGVLVENATPEEIGELYNILCKKLLKAHMERLISVDLKISAGCAMYPSDGQEKEQLYNYANCALQHGKRNGKNQLAFFESELLQDRENFYQTVQQLKSCITDQFQGFSLSYQPQVDAKTQQILGAEALLRWKTPEGAPVSPMVFIPLLEEYGLINQVSLWVVRQAVADAKGWVAVIPDFTVSVNISILSLLEERFEEEILAAIDAAGFPHENFIVEITESATAKNFTLLQEKLLYLRKMGLRIAMDDFGTEYSSLNILKNAPIDIVKIDKTFVRNITKDPFDLTFITSVVAICHGASFQVCLEGVEEWEQYRLVEHSGLDSIQGYLFGKPQPAQDISFLLQGSRVLPR